MSTKKYDVVVYIGRFQILHNAHVATIKRAQTLGDKVHVLVGSSYKPRTYKNPFTYAERATMIDASVGNKEGHLVLSPLVDYMYDDLAWAAQVQKVVGSHQKVAIIGHKKDDSSFYLDMFPQWDFIEQHQLEPLDASSLRGLYFTEQPNMNMFAGVVPTPVVDYMRRFAISPAFAEIVKERRFIEKYKLGFASLPYPPIFVCSDAVVIQSGNILLIKRKAFPGKGLWALPGGFVNANTDKSVEAAMLRELDEETGLKVPSKVIKGSIKEVKVFDAIDRSARGRTITHAFKIVFSDGEWNLPKIKAGDDAEDAQWVPISEVKSENMFDDHFDIISSFVGSVR